MNWEKANWGNIYPRSGKQLLLASGPDSDDSSLETADWLISDKKLTPLAGAQLRLYAKSYGQDWGPHYLTILVSTTDDQPASFSALPGFTNIEIPIPDDYKDFTECIADLSLFEGQEIYLAILHTSRTGLAFFIDDIYLEHFRFPDPEAQPPVFLTEPPLKGVVGEEYIYNFALSADPGADPLAITVKGRPKWMEYTPRENGGILRGIPNDDWIYFIKIEASDGTNSVYQEFEFEIIKAPEEG
ncbi:MAG: choice-of-anchor J domain-containing protein [Tannerellaceae bacterium]|nr:choice-of-anchor J domain-containing protein [Tannerellaceae bacterium]MCD8264614.1 choice-of-anchor J domain-containing protein [Tannerellaceae bacterium]